MRPHVPRFPGTWGRMFQVWPVDGAVAARVPQRRRPIAAGRLSPDEGGQRDIRMMASPAAKLRS